MAEQTQFPIKNIEDMSVGDIGKLALAQSILTESSYGFVIAVAKLEPFVIDDWQEYERDIDSLTSKIKREYASDSEDYKVGVAIIKYRYLVTKMKEKMPIDAVGLV